MFLISRVSEKLKNGGAVGVGVTRPPEVSHSEGLIHPRGRVLGRRGMKTRHRLGQRERGGWHRFHWGRKWRKWVHVVHLLSGGHHDILERDTQELTYKCVKSASTFILTDYIQVTEGKRWLCYALGAFIYFAGRLGSCKSHWKLIQSLLSTHETFSSWWVWSLPGWLHPIYKDSVNGLMRMKMV